MTDLHRGLGMTHLCSYGDWSGVTLEPGDVDGLADYIRHADDAGRPGVYARVTTLRRRLGRGERGGEVDSLALPGLWADLDIAGPGHKTSRPLPPDEAAVRQLVADSGLPAPTTWVHSGGGMYAWWLLDTPHVITDLDEVRALSAAWQRALAVSADRHGWFYGTGVADLARVLRVPGTVNKKVAGQPAPCRLLGGDGELYTLEDLRGGLADALTAAEPAARSAGQPASIQASTSATEVRPEACPEACPPSSERVLTPGDDWAARTDWASILCPHGWVEVRRVGQTRHWRRPGKDGRSTSATTGYGSQGRDLLFVFSDATEFEPMRSYSKLGALALLEHGGDHAAAARALRAAGYGSPAGPPAGSDVTDLLPPTSPAGPMLMAVGGTAVRPLVAPAGPQPGEAALPTPSWAPVDLASILDGSWVQPEPTLMPRTDGIALFYPGLVHSVHGESESGKSLIVQAEVARLLVDGQDVVYVDYESDAPSVVGRLLELGAPAAAIRTHFRYIHPELAPWRLPEEQAAWEQLLATPAALAVIDGVTDALGTSGAGSNDNDEISAWARRVPRVLATRTGAAVVLIDHVSKDVDSRGRYAVGGQAKMNALDGAAYLVETIEPLGRGLRGVIVLRIGKDRPGAIRPHCGTYRKSDRTQEAARIVVDSRGEGIQVTVEPPSTTPVTDRPAGDGGEDGGPRWRPTFYMERVSQVLEKDDALTVTQLRKAVRGKNEYIDQAAETLVEEGYVERRERTGRGGTAQLYVSLKPYREAADPGSDKYQGPTVDAGPEACPKPAPSLPGHAWKPAPESLPLPLPPYGGGGRLSEASRGPGEPPEPKPAPGHASRAGDQQDATAPAEPDGDDMTGAE